MVRLNVKDLEEAQGLVCIKKNIQVILAYKDTFWTVSFSYAAMSNWEETP